jgi:hypothetical protein
MLSDTRVIEELEKIRVVLMKRGDKEPDQEVHPDRGRGKGVRQIEKPNVQTLMHPLDSS